MGGSSCVAERRGAPQRADPPNDTTTVKLITSTASVLHNYCMSPEAGEQYTGVPGLYDHSHTGLLAHGFPPVMSGTRFPDGIACVACHAKPCRGMPVTMPLRGPMLPGGIPVGTAPGE